MFDENTGNLPPYIAFGKHRFDILLYVNDVASGGFKFYFSAVRPGQAD